MSQRKIAKAIEPTRTGMDVSLLVDGMSVTFATEDIPRVPINVMLAGNVELLARFVPAGTPANAP